MTSISSPDLSSASQQRQQESQKMREMMILPKDFTPTEMDVVIGRGKKARTHEGNNRLRGLIEFMIPEYQAAGTNKDEKSYIIKEIVTQIRKSSPDGGFVKFDKSKNRWFEVGDFLAREKISQTFRDAMGDSYSSSNPYKRKRRSFEKKHNAIMDIIKQRRGSSPTSVLQSGASSPNSPPSPEPNTVAVDASGMTPPPLPVATPSPSLTPRRQSQVLLESMVKRPGDIGFARRSSMLMGLAGPAATGMYAAPPPMVGLPMRLPGMPLPALRRPVPHLGAALPMPHTPRRASLPGAYSPAFMANMMNRQRMAQTHHAMLRRTSSGL